MICRIAAIWVFAVLLLGSSTAIAQVSHNYCQYATRTVVLLFDRTSPFDKDDKEALEHSLLAIDKYLDGRTFLSLQTIGENFTSGKVLLERCIPSCPQGSMIDVFVGSKCVPAQAQSALQDFRREFYSKLKQMTEQPEAASKSDIASRIVEVARVLNNPSRPISHLIIYSDMIDNVLVPHRAIYTQKPEDTMRVAKKDRILADLKGAHVAVFGFGRSDIHPRSALPPNQRIILQDFWTQWFKASGADEVSIGFRLKS